KLIELGRRRMKHNASGARYFGISQSTLENVVWSRYKPVSHLWAAYVQTAINGNSVFPCMLRDYAKFLGLAEYFRQTAEAIPLSHRGEKLPTAGKQWRVPPEIPLPPIKLVFG